MHHLNFQSSHNRYTSNVCRQHTFLSELSQIFETDNAAEISKVCAQLRAYQQLITQVPSVRVHCALQATSHTDQLVSVWSDHFHPKPFFLQGFQSALVSPPAKHHAVRFSNAHLHAWSGETVGQQVFFPMAAIESSYLITAVRSVTEFSDLRIPALNLAIEYLNALEGPLWKTIRGRGLSYNYYMYVSPDDGLMYFGLAKSSDIVAAYQEATKIVNNYANQVTPIDPLALQADKTKPNLCV
eukprot:TRINITY_DN6579_c0_g1_i9.p1 TRINITY_DN6579_c0_g1~~TRINITY_DN6579_c0_g1_i9.p1  ORF type:complete len:241 (+),score=50.99 TRINITY_DN6579_c0_g1_i9:52-774(+)